MSPCAGAFQAVASRVAMCRDRRPTLAHHINRHQEVRRLRQPHILATIHVELSRLFAAEAQGQEAVAAEEPDRAHHSMGRGAFCVEMLC